MYAFENVVIVGSHLVDPGVQDERSSGQTDGDVPQSELHIAVLPTRGYNDSGVGSRTIVKKKLSICWTTLVNESKSTGLVT